MTGYTVHTGSSKKFSQGWDRVFSGTRGSKGKTAKGRSADKSTAARSKKAKKK